jgi:hypothetical protein
MNAYKRHGLKWSIPEVLRLQREYELLGMPIQKIAKIHNRTYMAIEARIEYEGFMHDDDDDEEYL